MFAKAPVSAAVLLFSATSLQAGPCAPDIARMQGRILDKLGAIVEASPAMKEGRAHQQPTPKSIAAAEEGQGALSAGLVKAVKAVMAEAEEADRTGDLPACKRALADVQASLDGH